MPGAQDDQAWDEDRRARLALSRLVEPGLWSVQVEVEARGAAEVLGALLAGQPPGRVSAAVADAARSRAVGYDPARDAEALAGCGGRLLRPGDGEWPEHRLSWGFPDRSDGKLAAPPLSLHVRGALSLRSTVELSVAVVGARAATTYGELVATELGLGLADRGVAVVSGGAYGVDGAAHRGALTSANGVTLAVLACGVDVSYPRGHDRLLQRIAERGLIVSEHPPGATPTRARFLVRNRLIAALTSGTVVVEAAARSGSLSTAGRARDLSRPLMAVPGPVTSAMSAGCHDLLRTPEVTLVTGVGQIMDVVGPLTGDQDRIGRGEIRVRDDLPEVVRAVLDAVPARGGAGEATIARAAGVPPLVVQQVLPPLLVHGLVERVDTGWRLTTLGSGRPARR